MPRRHAHGCWHVMRRCAACRAMRCHRRARSAASPPSRPAPACACRRAPDRRLRDRTSTIRSSGRLIAVANTTGTRARQHRPQRVERRAELPGPGARGRVVEGDHEPRLGRSRQPAQHRRPRLEVVGERDRAEIVPERRPHPRGGGEQGGDAGHDLHIQRAPRRPRRSRSPRRRRSPSRTRPDRRRKPARRGAPRRRAPGPAARGPRSSRLSLG